MSGLKTAERVSRDSSDNFVFQRSLLAYVYTTKIVSGKVLEIGTGSGYGVEVIAPCTTEFVTIDKNIPPIDLTQYPNVEFRNCAVPPLPFEDDSFDCVISFQVIEHIKDDKKFVAEVHRVLKAGGRFIVSTPNIKMSLTRNPWHVREYTKEEFLALLKQRFSEVDAKGVTGGEKVMEYYEKNRASVEKITRFDFLKLQYRLPRFALQIPYDILNRLNRKKLLSNNQSLTESISMDDYKVEEVSDEAFDLLYIAKK